MHTVTLSNWNINRVSKRASELTGSERTLSKHEMQRMLNDLLEGLTDDQIDEILLEWAVQEQEQAA